MEILVLDVDLVATQQVVEMGENVDALGDALDLHEVVAAVAPRKGEVQTYRVCILFSISCRFSSAVRMSTGWMGISMVIPVPQNPGLFLLAPSVKATISPRLRASLTMRTTSSCLSLSRADLAAAELFGTPALTGAGFTASFAGASFVATGGGVGFFGGGMVTAVGGAGRPPSLVSMRRY